METAASDVIIVGGGIIGLASAFALSEAGYSIRLFDEHPGSGASWAAAGMLAPGAESTPEHRVLTDIALESLGLWPTFAERVSIAAGQRIDVQRDGSLFLAWDAADRREQGRYFAIADTQGISSRAVTRDGEPELFLGVSPRVSGGVLVEDDAAVEPDSVMSALIVALERHGAPITRERVTGISSEGSAVSVETTSGRCGARCAIVATGVWNEPHNVLSASPRRLRPVRGVTLRLSSTLAPGPMLRGTVHGRMIYVIRRSSGRVLVGASSDESAELVVESGTVRRLLDDATTLLPELDGASFLEARVGLRPTSDDHLPFFEEIGRNVAWSSGHFRHGFLLAPRAARRAVEFVRSVLA